ncbi:MAG: hypothetical protein ACE5IG_01975 [Dehalococcoidia bacterium]
MSRLGGWLLIGTGFVACPCHWPITLALVSGLVGGSAVGAFFATNTALVVGLALVYFVGAVAGGWYLLSRRRAAACDVPASVSPSKAHEANEA